MRIIKNVDEINASSTNNTLRRNCQPCLIPIQDKLRPVPERGSFVPKCFIPTIHLPDALSVDQKQGISIRIFHSCRPAQYCILKKKIEMINVTHPAGQIPVAAPVFRSYQGGYFKTLLSPEQSNGALAMLEFVLPKGSEPPPHLHENEDETFLVLEGTMVVAIDQTEHVVSSGEVVFAPRNVPHAFRIMSDYVRMINVLTPGDFWHFFMEFSKACSETPAISVPVPPTPEQIAYMAGRLTNRYHLQLMK